MKLALAAMLTFLVILGTATAQNEVSEDVASDNSMETKEGATSTEKVYSLSVLAGGGWSRDVSEFEDTRNELTLNRNQFSAFGRLLWRPGNLLTGGLEVGYMNFLSLKNETGGTAVKSAVPLYLMFSMSPFNGVDVTVGYGIAFMSATVTGASGTVHSSTVSTALAAALSYRYPVSERVRVGAEARYSYFDHLDDRVIAVSALISYRLTEY